LKNKKTPPHALVTSDADVIVNSTPFNELPFHYFSKKSPLQLSSRNELFSLRPASQQQAGHSKLLVLPLSSFFYFEKNRAIMIKISAIVIFAIILARFATGCDIQLEKRDMCLKLGEIAWGEHDTRCVTFVGDTLFLQCAAEENVQVRIKFAVTRSQYGYFCFCNHLLLLLLCADRGLHPRASHMCR
jgi:hypothetical protein